MTICYYCGSTSTSKEHIPPKCIFPKSTTGLLTVRSCDEHNAKKKHLDEKFRNHLVETSKHIHLIPKEVLKKTLRSYEKNEKYKAKISNAEKDEYNRRYYDIYDSKENHEDSFKYSLETIARGIIFHHFKIRYNCDAFLNYKCDSLIISPANSPEIIMHRREIERQLTELEKTFDYPIKYEGNNPDIFKYKCSEECVIMIFYQQTKAIVVFDKNKIVRK